METATDIIFDMCANGVCDSGCDSSLDSNITSSFNYTLCLDNTTDPTYYDTTPLPPTEWQDPSYYSLPYRVIGTIFQGIILIVGELTVLNYLPV